MVKDLDRENLLVWFFRFVLVFLFLILLARLFELTVIKGSYFRKLAEENRIRKIPILAPRGKILARGGEVLADNVKKSSFIVFDEEGIRKAEKEEKDKAYEEIGDWKRTYPYPQETAHITGYLGEVSDKELGLVRGKCPQKGPRALGNWIGRGGLEEFYDCELTGINGEELIEVNAYGEKVRVLGVKRELKGEDLRTTIDLGLQLKVFETMKDKRGAVVVTDPRGEVLALFSSPSFDTNSFINKDYSKISSFLENNLLPLFNRAISGKYHPGSIFKPLVAIAALEEGKINANFLYEDRGVEEVKTPYGNFSYSNWFFNQYGKVEGKINLVRAIARSTDTFFYKVGEMLGPETIALWGSLFGLDKKTGIDLSGEVEGLVPNPDWKLKQKNEKWFLGNTYHFSIGQGDLVVTPIAINQAISAIASNGFLCQPRISFSKEEKCQDLKIAKENIDLVKEGMKKACETGGTAYPFFDFKEKVGVDVACKTGTAQTEGNKNPHAWFVAFAPIENPEIIVTVLVENGGEGSKVAAPIAREIFNFWFLERKK